MRDIDKLDLLAQFVAEALDAAEMLGFVAFDGLAVMTAFLMVLDIAGYDCSVDACSML